MAIFCRYSLNSFFWTDSTVNCRFSFQTLSDRNMKMGCHAILFLQRVNLVPRSYIILNRTHKYTYTHTHTHTHTHIHTQFQQTFGRSRKSAETFGLRKILFLSKLDEKAGIYKEYNGSKIILKLKRIKGQTQGWGSLIMKVLSSPMY